MTGRESVPPATRQRNRAFIARWKGRLLGPIKLADFLCYYEDWATDGAGSFIDLLGIPIPWYDALDTILSEVEKTHPDFRIGQCKLKLGSVRMRLSNVPLAVNLWISDQIRPLNDGRDTEPTDDKPAI